MAKTKRIIVWRSPLDSGGAEKYDEFQVPTSCGTTVLDALFYIQHNLDDSLAFRYSCRGAVCGSDAMLINKVPRLACKTQIHGLFEGRRMELKAPFQRMLPTIEWNPEEDILIEPLPNFNVVKDLVVDLTPFFEKLKKVRPWILSATPSEKMTPEKTRLLERVANCFLCASCYGSCPINNQSSEYLGPAALAWAWRFIEDPSDEETTNRLEELNSKPEGAYGCDFFFNCVRVCPRQVAPAIEIRKIREKIEKQ